MFGKSLQLLATKKWKLSKLEYMRESVAAVHAVCLSPFPPSSSLSCCFSPNAHSCCRANVTGLRRRMSTRMPTVTINIISLWQQWDTLFQGYRKNCHIPVNVPFKIPLHWHAPYVLNIIFGGSVRLWRLDPISHYGSAGLFETLPAQRSI